jgi:fructokinase
MLHHAFSAKMINDRGRSTMNLNQPIVAIGEILWDVFPDGPRFGGAPANFACHIAGLGARSAIVSAVGADDLGRAALDELAQRAIEVAGVQRIPDRPTGTVLVTIDTAGKPSYEFRRDVAWDHLEWNDTLAALAAQAVAVCFGTLAQRSPESSQTIQKFVKATPSSCLRVFDINLRDSFHGEEIIGQSLDLANAFKLNDDELPIIAAMFGLKGSESEVVAGLSRRFGLGLVAQTRGARGALLWRKSGEISDLPGIPTEVRDTVGAGDAFTAALTLGLLQGRSLEEINRHASRIAAYVCTQPGAAPRLPAELRLSQ